MSIRCTPSHLHGEIELKSNDSSNIFLLCAGALSKDGITLKGFKADGFVSKIPETLEYMGANVSRNNDSITVSRNRLFGMPLNVNGNEIEFLIYCAVASVCEKGFTQITGLHTINREAVDLTVKTLTEMRVACSFDDEDELIIWGGNEIIGGTLDVNRNVYMALALTVISCEANICLDIRNTGGLEKIFPDYIKNFNLLNGKIEIIK